MTGKAIKDMVASVRGRLLNIARRTGKPYNAKNRGHILIRALSLSNSFLNLSSSLSLF